MSRKRSLRNGILAVAVAGALGVTGVALAAVPAGAQFKVLTRATQLNRGAVVTNVVPLARTVHVTVALKLRDSAKLDAFLARAKQARTPAAQHRLTRAQLKASYLPTNAQARKVADYLKRAGFTNVHVQSGNMLVTGDATVATVQSAFRTTLVNVRTRNGRTAFVNSSPIRIPAALQSTVQAVLGLQTLYKAHTMARPLAGGAVGVEGHSPLDFPHIYGASGLHAATSVKTGVWGWGSMQASVNDLKDFMAQTGLKTTVRVVCTDVNGIDFNTGEGLGGTTIGDPTCNGNVDQGEDEWSMDSQSILAMSGGTKSLTFYAAYGGYNTTVTDALNEIVNPSVGEPLPQVINGSFGECERAEDAGQGGDGSAQADDALFRIAVAQGQTFTISTGDDGYDECGDGKLDSASYPASSPWVVAVSGTTLRASNTTWARENVWIDSGGSPSSFEPAQPWQASLTFGKFKGARGPDVAFDGNPNSGELVLISGQLEQIGGTSLSAPLFAGAWARILQSDPKLGFAAPHLYAIPRPSLHDIRAGNNGHYIARPGWDWATGLGSFNVGEAAAALK